MSRLPRRARWPCVLCLACMPALAGADAPAPPPPNGVWIGRGQFGFLDSKGNSDAESVNGNIDLSRYDGPWKNDLYLTALYGRSGSIVSAERYEGLEQTNYAFAPRLFVFGGLRYEHDLFDGFEYQESLTAGLGYKLLDSTSDTLTLQLGAGYRRLRPEIILKNAESAVISRIPLEVTSGAIGSVTVDYAHKFSPSTTLSNKLYSEIGSTNRLINDQLNLAVKMSTHLALTVGYGFIDNSNPPPPLKKVDTVTTVNLQFSF